MRGDLGFGEGGGAHGDLEEAREAAGDERDGLKVEGLPRAQVADVPPEVGLLAVAAVEFEFGAKVDGGIWAREVFGQGEGWVGVAVILEFLGDHGGSALGNGDGWRDEGRCTGLMGWCVGGGAVGG